MDPCISLLPWTDTIHVAWHTGCIRLDLACLDLRLSPSDLWPDVRPCPALPHPVCPIPTQVLPYLYGSHHVLGPIIGPRPNSTIIPGNSICERSENRWHAHYCFPLLLVKYWYILVSSSFLCTTLSYVDYCMHCKLKVLVSSIIVVCQGCRGWAPGAILYTKKQLWWIIVSNMEVMQQTTYNTAKSTGRGSGAPW